MLRAEVFDAITYERIRQAEKGTDINDAHNTNNDWIAFVTAYLGRAASGVNRNMFENCDRKDNLIKAAAIIVAALEQLD